MLDHGNNDALPIIVRPSERHCKQKTLLGEAVHAPRRGAARTKASYLPSAHNGLSMDRIGVASLPSEEPTMARWVMSNLATCRKVRYRPTLWVAQKGSLGRQITSRVRAS